MSLAFMVACRALIFIILVTEKLALKLSANSGLTS